MSLQNKTVKEFTDLLAAKTSVPGGGGASALAASVGIALGSMVGQFTLGKKKYADVEPDIQELMEKAEELQKSLLQCIDRDAEAFEPLSKAYSIPKDNPDRDAIMEECLRNAAKVPFEILELSCAAIDLQREFADKGSKLMISDSATGAAILAGAIRGAAVNVKINTSSMKDRTYAEALEKKAEALLGEYIPKADKIYEDVVARI
ncbi:MAG: cyclodeaminase/cyclohydrolase family protein [Pseudobutyrivibrio sp.]|nr:cyclodeaminase/cyclohydrolase family protein [Pseudobutyrivibrio sp.]